MTDVFDLPGLRVTRVTEPMMGEHCYLLTDKASGRSAVVDPGLDFSGLRGALDALEEGSVDYILLTHGHFDHIGGVGRVKSRFPDAKVCIHPADGSCLTDPDASLASFFGMPATETEGADLALWEGCRLKLGGTELVTRHTPGHSPGSVIFVCPGCWFTGDTLFRGSCGRTDMPGGDPRQIMASFETMARLFEESGEIDVAVFPGHGEETTMETELRTNIFYKRRHG